jgi:hypothetical protein
MNLRSCGLLVTLALLIPAGASGQEGSPDPNQELLDRIRELEQRVKSLEKTPEEKAPAKPEPDSEWKLGAAEPADPDAEWVLAPAPAAEPAPAAKPAPSAGPTPYRSSSGYYGRRFGYGYRGGGLEAEMPYGLRARLSGQIRARGEYRGPDDLRIPGQAGRPATDDDEDASDFALLRTRIKLDVAMHDYARAVIEIQDSRTWGDAVTGTDNAEVQLRQGFIELGESLPLPFWVWVGRWRVPELGSSRLISGGDFSNVTRSWDGVQLFGHLGGTESQPLVHVTALAANIREGRVFSSDGDENDDFWFSGVYSTVHLHDMFEVDLYVFWRHLSDRVFTSEKRTRLGDRKDFTLGSLLHFKQKDVFSLILEAAWQHGDQAGDRVRAWATAVRGWFQIKVGEEARIQFTSEYAYASGDRDPTDGKRQTFDPLVPLTHRHHGAQDLFGWSNIHNPSVGVRYYPFNGLKFVSTLHGFWLDKRSDAWFRAGGAVVRRDTTGKARSFVGLELDLLVIYRINRHVEISGGYSHFWAGQYVRDTGKATAGRGSGADQDWVHLSVELGF